MNLIADIGNTVTKVYIFDGNERIYRQQVKNFTPELLAQLLNSYSLKKAIVSSVRSEGEAHYPWLTVSIAKVIWLNAHTPLPITNAYQTPGSLGYDRLAAAAGAHWLYPGSTCLVVDMGTAVTYDLITAEGVFLGGAIAPGLRTRLHALHSATKQLPLVEPAAAPTWPGATTEMSIRAGTQQGIWNEIYGYEWLAKEKYPKVKTILTGGDLFYFEKKVKNTTFVEPYLVAIGLNSILNYNAS